MKVTPAKKTVESVEKGEPYTRPPYLDALIKSTLAFINQTAHKEGSATSSKMASRDVVYGVLPGSEVYLQIKSTPPVSKNPTTEDDSEKMDSVSRDELDAKLAANVAEVKSVASEMRAEMAGLRSENAIQFSALKEQLTALQAAIETRASQTDAKVEALSAKVDGVEKGIEGKIDGVKTAVSTTQWVVTVVVAVAALPGFVSFFSKEEPKPSAPAVVVVQQPTAPIQQVQPPSANKPVK